MDRFRATLVLSLLLLAEPAGSGVIPESHRPRAERLATWRVALVAAADAESAGDPREAERIYREVIEQANDTGEDGMLVARAVDSLADLCRDQERWAEADRFYRRSVAMLERVLGPGQPRLAVSLYNLAVVEARRGAHAEAETHLSRAIRIFESSLGPDSAQARSSRELYRTLSALRRPSPAIGAPTGQSAGPSPGLEITGKRIR